MLCITITQGDENIREVEPLFSVSFAALLCIVLIQPERTCCKNEYLVYNLLEREEIL